MPEFPEPDKAAPRPPQGPCRAYLRTVCGIEPRRDPGPLNPRPRRAAIAGENLCGPSIFPFPNTGRRPSAFSRSGVRENQRLAADSHLTPGGDERARSCRRPLVADRFAVGVKKLPRSDPSGIIFITKGRGHPLQQPRRIGSGVRWPGKRITFGAKSAQVPACSA